VKNSRAKKKGKHVANSRKAKNLGENKDRRKRPFLQKTSKKAQPKRNSKSSKKPQENVPARGGPSKNGEQPVGKTTQAKTGPPEKPEGGIAHEEKKPQLRLKGPDPVHKGDPRLGEAQKGGGPEKKSGNMDKKTNKAIDPIDEAFVSRTAFPQGDAEKGPTKDPATPGKERGTVSLRGRGNTKKGAGNQEKTTKGCP